MSVHARGRHQTRRRSRIAWIAAGGVLAVGLPVGAVWAAWSVSGTGPGAAKAATAVSLTVSAGTPTATLYPGATGDVAFSVTNPNSFPVSVTTAVVNSVDSISGAQGSCATSDFTTAAGTVPATPIAAGATVDILMTGGLTMKTTAPNGCQAAVVTVTGTLSGTQA